MPRVQETHRMSNSAVSLPSPLAGVTAVTSELSVVSDQHVANVSTALPTCPSQVQFISAPASSVAATPSFIIPPIQTSMASNSGIPFQIVRRKIIVHGTGGPACINHQQTVPIVQNSITDVSVPNVLQIIQDQSAGKVQILQNTTSSNVQILQNQPSANVQILQNQPAANVQFLQNQPAANVKFLQNQPANNVQILQNQPAANVQFLQNQPVTNVQILQNQPQTNIKIVQNPSQTNVQFVQNQSQFVNQLQNNFQIISSQPQVIQNQNFGNMQVILGPSPMVQNQGLILTQVQTPDGPKVVQSQTGTLGFSAQTGVKVFTPLGGGPSLPVYRYPSDAKIAPQNTPVIIPPKCTPAIVPPTPQSNIRKVVDNKIAAQVPEQKTNPKGLLKELLLPRFDKLGPVVQKRVKERVKGGKKIKGKRKIDEDEIFDESGSYKPPVFFNIDKPNTEDEMEISFGGTSVVPKFAIEFCPGGMENYVSAVAHAVDSYKSKAELAKLEQEAKIKKKKLKQENRNHALKMMKMAKEAASSTKISRRKQTLAVRNDHFDDEMEFQSGSTTKKKCKLISSSIAHAKKSKKTAYKSKKTAYKSKKTAYKSKKTAYKRMNSKVYNGSESKMPSGQEEAVTEGDLGEVAINPNPGNSNSAETMAAVEIVTDKSVMSTADSSAEVPTEVGVFIPPSISKEIPLNPDDQADLPSQANAVDPAVIHIAHTGSDRIRIAVSDPDSIKESQLPFPVHKIKIEPRESPRLSNSASSSSTSSSTSKKSTNPALQSLEEGKIIAPDADMDTDMDTCSSVPTASPLFVKSVKTEPVEANIKHELDPRKMTSEELSADPFQLGKMPSKTKAKKKSASVMDIPRPVGVHNTETPTSVKRTSECILPVIKVPPPALRRKTARLIVAPARYGQQGEKGVQVKPGQMFEQSKLSPVNKIVHDGRNQATAVQGKKSPKARFLPRPKASSVTVQPSKHAPVLGPFNFISKPSEICVTPQVPTSVNCDTIQKKPVFIVSESVYKALYNAHTTGKSLHLNSSPLVPPMPKNGQTANVTPQLETDQILQHIQQISNQPNVQPHSLFEAGQSGGKQVIQVASEQCTGLTATPVGVQSRPTMMSRQTLLHQAVTSSQSENSKHQTSIVQQLNMSTQKSSLRKSNQNSKDQDVMMQILDKGMQSNPVHSTAILQDLNSFPEKYVNEISQNQGKIASELNIDSVFSLNKASCSLMNKVPSYLEMCLNSKLEHSLRFCLVVLDRRMSAGFRGKRGTKKTRLHVPRVCAESCRTGSLNLMCNSNMFHGVRLRQFKK